MGLKKQQRAQFLVMDRRTCVRLQHNATAFRDVEGGEDRQYF